MMTPEPRSMSWGRRSKAGPTSSAPGSSCATGPRRVMRPPSAGRRSGSTAPGWPSQKTPTRRSWTGSRPRSTACSTGPTPRGQLTSRPSPRGVTAPASWPASTRAPRPPAPAVTRPPPSGASTSPSAKLRRDRPFPRPPRGISGRSHPCAAVQLSRSDAPVRPARDQRSQTAGPSGRSRRHHRLSPRPPIIRPRLRLRPRIWVRSAPWIWPPQPRLPATASPPPSFIDLPRKPRPDLRKLAQKRR